MMMTPFRRAQLIIDRRAFNPQFVGTHLEFGGKR
jgi:hypothetical protein